MICYLRCFAAGLILLADAGCSYQEQNFFPNDSRFNNTSCRAIANDRANDAGMIGDDEQTQTGVFKQTYVDCVDWHRTH
ncbi:MAG TPA: hypothetical protein VGK90_13840 [Rhizomicrobium sp.]